MDRTQVASDDTRAEGKLPLNRADFATSSKTKSINFLRCTEHCGINKGSIIERFSFLLMGTKMSDFLSQK